MDFQHWTYKIARLMIQENQHHLHASDVHALLGWARQRNVGKLSNAVSLLSPYEHCDVWRYKTITQVEALFKKSSAFTDDGVALNEAIKSFLAAEEQCSLTNRAWRDSFGDPISRTPSSLNGQVGGGEEGPKDIVPRVKRVISDVLGSFEDFLEEMPRRVRITNGATATRPRRKAQPHRKMSLRPICTAGAAKYLTTLYKYFGYERCNPQVIDWNRVDFVPKSWKTHRTIACEPDGNLVLQLAFDDYCKDRLRRILNVDLSKQDRNQTMARQGSMGIEYDPFVTIDLAMASDTLSKAMLLSVIPYEWVDFLGGTRCPTGKMPDGVTLRYEKYSSMGNGSTFTLETLVFSSLLRVLTGDRAGFDWSVYGDDIVCRQSIAQELIGLLKIFGFSVNLSKSHLEGPFRESCGGNYFNGVDVTPFYLRTLHNSKSTWAHIINGLASVAVPYGKLMFELAHLAKQMEIQIVPYNSDTLTGVFIHPHLAYKQKLLHQDPKRKGSRHNDYQTLSFMGYVSKNPSMRVDDTRALSLWYIDANRRLSFEAVERSKVQTTRAKYRLSRVSYRPQEAPAWLYAWSEVLMDFM